MLCQECKERQATVHLTQIINNHKTELHLCEECANKLNDFSKMPSFSVNDLISSFIDAGVSKPSYVKQSNIKCEKCGMNLNQFRKINKFGCQECYKYFSDQVAPILRKIQGGTEHTGKVPKRSGVQISVKKQLEKLKKDLQKAIDNEAYEKAAEIRDAIKEFEKENESGEGKKS